VRVVREGRVNVGQFTALDCQQLQRQMVSVGVGGKQLVTAPAAVLTPLLPSQIPLLSVAATRTDRRPVLRLIGSGLIKCSCTRTPRNGWWLAGCCWRPPAADTRSPRVPLRMYAIMDRRLGPGPRGLPLGRSPPFQETSAWHVRT
jgi:hypothetical protein